MESTKIRRAAIVAGALFITATVATIISQIILSPIIGGPDYLANVSANRNLWVLGVLLELVDAFAVAGIAISVFPVLRSHDEGIAIGYVGFRVIEACIAIVASISLLSLLTLSQEFVLAGAPEASNFQNLGAFLLAAHDWAYLNMLIAFSLGALLFYYLLYQSGLVPRFISAWGFIGSIMALTASLLDMFGIIRDGSAISNLLFFPIAVNEMVLAVWLIAIGFNSPAVASGAAPESSLS